MTQKEFEERTGVSVSPSCYHGLIEPEYMNSDLDKDEWCKQWKRKKGLQVAYFYEQGRADEAIKQAKQYRELSERRMGIIAEQNKTYNQMYADAKSKDNEIAELKAKLLKYETAMSAMKEIMNF